MQGGRVQSANRKEPLKQFEGLEINSFNHQSG
jgi:hypothetical protein